MSFLNKIISLILVGASSLTIPAAVARKNVEHEEIPAPSNSVEIMTVPYITENLGEFKVTAYCSCSKCCGIYAKNRPVDNMGNAIVYTACGERARPGCTVAADTDILPFGTIIFIDGNAYKVQDTGSAVKGNHVDIYFSNHQQALNWGCQYKEVERYIG